MFRNNSKKYKIRFDLIFYVILLKIFYTNNGYFLSSVIKTQLKHSLFIIYI